MANRIGEMERGSDELNQSQPRSGEDTRGFGEEEVEETEDLEEEEADEFESDERLTGEVGSEGGGEGDVEIDRPSNRDRIGSDRSGRSEP
jgi:hypothetical protein